jgi:hypothetical protein
MPLAPRPKPTGDMPSPGASHGTCPVANSSREHVPVAPMCRTGHAHPHTPARDMSSLGPNQRGTCPLLGAASGQNGFLPTGRGCRRACPMAMMGREEHALLCRSSRHMSGSGCGPVTRASCLEPARRGTCSLLNATSGQNGILPTDRGCGWTYPVVWERGMGHIPWSGNAEWDTAGGLGTRKGTCPTPPVTAEHVQP